MYSSNKTLVGDVATILFIFHKFYMNIKPNFIENNIYIDFKIHIKLTIKDLVNILKAIFIAAKNSKTIKEEDNKYESSRFNTKYNGNNA